jgi:putative ABC transport system permease protein
MKSIDRKLLRDLMHMRGQMIAVALVVACGIATYVAMVSVYDSLQATRAAYYDRYRFADVFANTKRAPESIIHQIEAIDGVAAVSARVVTEVTLDVPGLDDPAIGRIVSIPEHHMPMLNDLYLRRGRYIEPGRGDQAIISEAFAEANGLVPGDSLGAIINGRWKQLRVVGIGLTPEYIYEAHPSSIFPDNRRFGILWMSHDALAAAFDMEGAFNDITLRLTHGAREQDVIARLDDLLEQYGSLGAYGRSENVSFRFLNDELTQLQANALFVPVIFLGVAAFLLNMVLSRLVATQRDQVAVLKAFGYSNAAIGIHFLKFSLSAVLVGAVIGTLGGMYLGSALTGVYTKYYRFPFLNYIAGWQVVAQAIFISGTASVIGALSAVRRSVSLPPAEAMRPEPPARFKPGIVERIGLGRLFSTSVRMIVRSLERNPWKAFISSFGIALSVAIVIVGRFSFDSIDYMMDLQFRKVQREDVTVVFNRPLSARAAYDLPHLPGTVSVELFRSVPVRVRAGHRQRRLGIQGVVPGTTLHRIIDVHQNIVTLPPDGLVLTKKLAELLAVDVGDTLTVEVLEGSRPIHRIPIAALVDEVLGLSIYMNQASLHRMLGEGETISGAYLTVNKDQQDELYEQLKRTPAVGGTMLREATLESFKKTIAESQGISAFALTFFASVIAIGIVYNSARIGLSERGRELASLRVLGFTKGEVAAMLLGEQAILLLIAIPLGFLLGYMISAMLTVAVSNDMYRMPMIISGKTYAFATVVVVGAGIISAVLVRRRLFNLDLIEVLKTRE